jgi:hypothetical protein
MHVTTFWKRVTMDDSDFLPQLAAALRAERIAFAVIGGQGVNAYVDPLVSLDLDLVVAADQLEQVETLLRREFRVERFSHSLNASKAGSSLRVQVQTDPRYSPFVARATERDVLGVKLPVADVRDVLQGKIWAASDPARRASKRQKDLADIARLVERFPELKSMIPDDVARRLI